MRKITAFTSDPTQTMILVLNDGSKVEFSMTYFPNQVGWFYSFTYGTFEVLNRRMVTSPNMIRALRGVLPFGLAITTLDGLEPIYVDDFITGRASFYLLDADDVAGVETMISIS